MSQIDLPLSGDLYASVLGSLFTVVDVFFAAVGLLRISHVDVDVLLVALSLTVCVDGSVFDVTFPSDARSLFR